MALRVYQNVNRGQLDGGWVFFVFPFIYFSMFNFAKMIMC